MSGRSNSDLSALLPKVTATITSKGQITIPKRIRTHLGLEAGSVLSFETDVPYLKAHRVVDRAKARKMLGSKAKELKGKTVDEQFSAAA